MCSGIHSAETHPQRDVAAAPIADEQDFQPAVPQFAARGWTKVGDQEFTYLGEHLPSPTRGDEDDDDEPATDLIKEVKERLKKKEAGVKDTTSKSLNKFTLVELLAPSATQSKELADAGFNIKSDAALVLIARAAGVSITEGHLGGCLLAECALTCASIVVSEPC